VPLALAKEQSSGATTLVVDAATAALEADSPYAAERELDERQSERCGCSWPSGKRIGAAGAGRG
jgi:hypothetical protein